MVQKIKDILLAIIPFAVIILIWQISWYFSLFPRWLIPSPLETLLTFCKLIQEGSLIGLIWISVENVVIAFLLAFVFAFILGTLIGINPTIKKIFFPFLSAIYPIPSLAYLPLVILILGFTRETVLFVVFISAFRKMIYNVIGGVRNVNPNWILAGKNLGLSKLRIVFKIILPAALPQIITGVRMGFGSAWRSLIGAEMLVVGVGGLGKFIWMAQWFLDFNKVFTGIIVIALIGVFIEQFVFKQIEKRTLIRWGLVQE